jgi:hypothetical protein
MDCVVIYVTCLRMPNNRVENDGKYETEFLFFNTVIFNMTFIYTEGILNSIEPDNM